MRKICFITTISMTLKAFVCNLANYMYESGEFEIYFICDKDEEFEKDLPPYIHYIPVSMKRGISIDGLKATWNLVRIFQKYQFDIIQYSTPNASCYAAIAGFIARVPVRLYCQWGIAYVGFTGFKRKILKCIEKMVCSLSTWVEPDSNSNLRFSREEKLYPVQKGSVVWNGSASGVDLKKFDLSKKERWRDELRLNYGIPKDAVVYIFIGRITKDKGVNELLEASKKLLVEHENTYLLLVGSMETGESVNSDLYQWSKEEERVIYCGYTKEVEKNLAASDVYLLPSYREGFGSAVIEAEAMEVPVIVSDIPGPVDAMKKNVTGITVPKKDAGKLYEGMLYLYQNPKLRTEYGKNGAKFVTECFEQTELFRRILMDRKKLLDEKSRF